MLEELMSQYVDVDNKDFWDESVCKHYLVAFCPSQLFTNTKSDLGPCDKIHNDRLKERYQNAPDKQKYPFEADFYDYLNKLIMDLARRIRQGKGRLNIQCDDKSAEARKEEREEKMVLLDVKIKELLQKSEEAGEEGRVQEATELTSQVEKLQEELEHLRNNEDDSIKLEKRMEVCQVCGAFLVTNDSSDRLEAHYQGKQHQGYLKIRDTLEQMKQTRPMGRDRDFSRARFDYNRDRRDGGRERDYRRYSDRDRGGFRERDNRRRSRDRRGNDDDWDREVEKYSRRSRRDYDDMRRRSRSRSPRARYD
ncbi:Luc7-like protein 3 [Apophysomyces sp. BC1034]|nr:Luc7-like protein 3 [Apophysomyces sp. BC1034]